MLELASRSGGEWLARALADLDTVLVDHVHCEKKAASTALSLLFRYPERATLLVPLARLAREELAHFEQVLGQLAARGVAFRHQVPSPYAERLRQGARRHEPARLLDSLLCAALIEARSHERLGLLAAAVEDPVLAGLYRRLVEAEAAHQSLYVDLARAVAPEEEVRSRLEALAAHEAAVLAGVPPLPRLHG